MKEKRGLRFSKKAIDLRERFSSGIILRSVIIFVLSMLIYLFTNTYPITALAGFVGIISGTIIMLFTIIFLIFYFLERMKYSKSNLNIKRKVAKKKVSVKKKVITKKTVKKKAPAKKKVVKKKTTIKKVVKKKIIKKKK